MQAGEQKWLIDTSLEETRQILDFLTTHYRSNQRGVQVEILTDNHADGIYLLNRIRKQEPIGREIINLLEMHGDVRQEPSLPMLIPWQCAPSSETTQ